MEEADDKQQGTNDEAAEKKEVCCSQVQNVDRDGILGQLEDQEPQHSHVSCHSNWDNDKQQQVQDYLIVTRCVRELTTSIRGVGSVH